MFKKIICMMLCCLMLTACGEKGIKFEANEQRPTYRGHFWCVFDVDIEDKTVPDGFITRKMASDIKKVIKAHQSKNELDDGSINEEAAVDIAIVIMKNTDKSYFEKPTFYCISYRLDVDAYFIDIGQENENPNVAGGLSTKMIISKKDGSLLAIWTS